MNSVLAWDKFLCSNKGMTLMELMIVNALASVLVLAVMQLKQSQQQLVINNKIQAELTNQSLLFKQMLKKQLSVHGMNAYPYDFKSLHAHGWSIQELEVMAKHTVITTASFPSHMDLKSYSKGHIGNPRDSDRLVINAVTKLACNGTVFENQQPWFYTVNEFYLEEGNLKCKAYNGHNLLANVSSSSREYSVSLINNLQSLTIEYAVIVKDSELLGWTQVVPEGVVEEIIAIKLTAVSSIGEKRLSALERQLPPVIITLKAVPKDWLETI